MKELKPISTTLVEVTLFGVWGDGGQWFQPHNVTCRILVPWPGIEPAPSAVKLQSPNL